MRFTLALAIILPICLAIRLRHVQQTPCPSGWTFFRDSCYKKFNTPATWGQAQYLCNQAHSNPTANLPTVNDAAENNFIQTLAGPGNNSRTDIWIGLFRSEFNTINQFRWVSGSNAGFRNWNQFQPDGRYACAKMSLINSAPQRLGYWAAVNCTVPHPYVCEFRAVATPTPTPIITVNPTTTSVPTVTPTVIPTTALPTAEPTLAPTATDAVTTSVPTDTLVPTVPPVTQPPTKLGRVRVVRASDGLYIGCIRDEFVPGPGCQADGVFQINTTYPTSLKATSGLYADSDSPYFGAISNNNPPNLSDEENFDDLVTYPTQYTDPGVTPKPLGEFQYFESSIWTLENTNELTARWVNTDGTYHRTLIFFNQGFNTIYLNDNNTGDTDRYEVKLYFVEQLIET